MIGFFRRHAAVLAAILVVAGLIAPGLTMAQQDPQVRAAGTGAAGQLASCTIGATGGGYPGSVGAAEGNGREGSGREPIWPRSGMAHRAILCQRAR